MNYEFVISTKFLYIKPAVNIHRRGKKNYEYFCLLNWRKKKSGVARGVWLCKKS